MIIISKKDPIIIQDTKTLKSHIIQTNMLSGEIKELKCDERLQELLSIDRITTTEFIKKVKKIYNAGKCNNNTTYWMNRGFTLVEAKEKVFECQSKRAYSIPEKRRKEIGKLRCSIKNEMYKGRHEELSPFCKEFWLLRGYSETEAPIKALEENRKTGTRKYLETKYTKDEIAIIDSKKSLPGCKNGMYGRVPGRGTGAGISGLYDGKYFRSSYEYFYMKKLEKDRIEYQVLDDGISSKMLIEIGEGKTYTPDFFLVKEKKIIDVKNSYNVTVIREKVKKIKEFCIKFGYTYETIHKHEIDVDWNMFFQDIDNGLVIIDEKKIEKLERARNAESNRNKIYITI